MERKYGSAEEALAVAKEAIWLNLDAWEVFFRDLRINPGMIILPCQQSSRSKF